jgi:hypothetical protein
VARSSGCGRWYARPSRVRLSPFFSALTIASLVAHDARGDGATWLPGSDRVIARTTSASRDTPLLEYAYGPRAQASIGMEPGIVEVRGVSLAFRAGLYAMTALENATSERLFPPSELWRGLVGASFALALPNVANAWLGSGSDFEIGLIVGHESDHATSGSTSTLGPPGPLALPYGAGGDFVAPDVAIRFIAGRTVTLTLRLADRLYFNAFPLIVGARGASDTIAQSLHEGVANAPGADLILRWRASASAEPQLALYGEHLFSRESTIPDGQFFRAMAGVALPGRVGELEPFVSLDGGNGKGLLVEEREVRVSVGGRYAAF